MKNLFYKIAMRVNMRRGITPLVTEVYYKTRRFLSKNPKIIEAGAHMGFDTIGLSTIWPKSTIYAFEPVPNIFAELCSRCNGRANVNPLQLALGNTIGTAEMFVSEGSSTASSSLLAPTVHLKQFPTVTFDKKVAVHVTTLNDWATKEGIDQIDLMWLDLQGYEINALEGASRLLPNVSVIFMELCRYPLYEGMPVRQDCIRYLEEKGFCFIGELTQTDISEGIFVNRRLSHLISTVNKS